MNTPIVVLLTVAAMVMAGCSSSDDSADPTTTVSAGSDTASDSSGSDTSDDAETDSTADDSGGTGGTSGEMTIETDTGESWTLEQYRCLYQPDNEGRFVQLWTAGGTLPSGGDFLVQQTTSPDPATPDEILIDGSFVDDDKGIVYVAIEGEASSDGSTMTMTLGMHDSPNKVVGDPIDLTATVTCEL